MYKYFGDLPYYKCTLPPYVGNCRLLSKPSLADRTYQHRVYVAEHGEEILSTQRKPFPSEAANLPSKQSPMTHTSPPVCTRPKPTQPTRVSAGYPKVLFHTPRPAAGGGDCSNRKVTQTTAVNPWNPCQRRRHTFNVYMHWCLITT